MIIALSTNNAHKAKEIEQILLVNRIDGVRIVLPNELLDTPFDVEENGSTLEENASIKANALFYAINKDKNRNLLQFNQESIPVVADDTGLEVAALNGAPGVYSARFAGLPANDANNRKLLLAKLGGASDRSARFRTALCLKSESGEMIFEGICNGRIIETETGFNGFGYDSLFVPDGFSKTFAELSDEEKNAISHRGRAVENFLIYLREELGR